MSQLSPSKGANRVRKRVGRGIGSGVGKTSGRGGKGQTARKGGNIPARFEGGQTPLYRRIPKRGFTNIFKEEWLIVNVGDIVVAINKGQLTDPSITIEALRAAGLVKNHALPLKLLGNVTPHAKGFLSALSGKSIQVDAASKAASKIVEDAGGTIARKSIATQKV